MNKKIFIILIFIFPGIILAKDSDFKKEGWMPTGEIIQGVMETTKSSNDSVQKMIQSAQKLINQADEMILAVTSCQDKTVCKSSCKENYDSEGNCSCSGSSCEPQNLCDMETINSIYQKIQETSVEFQKSNDDYLDIISGSNYVPDYLKTLYKEEFTELPKSHVYTDYNEFYNNFNNIISPLLSKFGRETKLPIADKNQKIPFMEYIKRQSDYARIGFYNCQTPVGAEQDMENIADGKSLYKYPYRVDFILLNSMSIDVQEDESNLNYYCASTQGFYSPDK